jgi:ferredoxin-nitrite reductase
MQVAYDLEKGLGHTGPLTIHWSGCPNACGNHTVADIGLLGKKARIDGKVVDAVDVFLGDRLAGRCAASVKSLENVPCDQLPGVLERLLSTPAALIA